MPDKPILFSGPMVQALLDGRKTQTRRVIKSNGSVPEFCGGRYDAKNDPESWGWENAERGDWITLDQWRHWNFVPYNVGDRLWVREAWSGEYIFRNTPPAERESHVGEGVPYFRDSIWYWADGSPEFGDWERPRPSIHMPRWASRLTLIVNDVRVQRLHDMTLADVIREGVVSDRPQTEIKKAEGQIEKIQKVFDCFQATWDSLNAKRGFGWDANPWVVAYTFEVHHQNIDQMPAGCA